MTTARMTKLRPLGMGELLDHAFRLYRRNFFTFIGIIAIVQIPITLLSLLNAVLNANNLASLTQTYTGTTTPSVGDILGPNFGWGFIINIINFIFVRGLATAALTRAVAGDYLGEPIGFIDAYRKVGKSWSKVVVALLLAGLINFLLALYWIIIPCVGWLTGAGMFFFFSGIVVQIIPAIIILERQTAGGAIRRGWDLTRRRFWWVVGFVALLTVFSLVIVVGPTMLISGVLQFAMTSLSSQNATTALIITTVIQSLVTLVMTLIYMPLQLAAQTLLYFDLRVRTEGFDLIWTAERVLDADTALEDIVAQAPAPEAGSIVTGNEMGQFILLSIAFVGLIMALTFFFGAFGVLSTGLGGGF